MALWTLDHGDLLLLMFKVQFALAILGNVLVGVLAKSKLRDQ